LRDQAVVLKEMIARASVASTPRYFRIFSRKRRVVYLAPCLSKIVSKVFAPKKFAPRRFCRHSFPVRRRSKGGAMAATEESRIGKGTKISGNLHFHGTVRIEGEADGEIVGDEIVIAEGAVVSAKITATRLTVAGTVSGEIVVRQRLELMASARLRCTVNTPTLILNEGAQFEGDCRMPRDRMAA
jgi:cytoskeletal protein CcmA (bactofilin family)